MTTCFDHERTEWYPPTQWHPAGGDPVVRNSQGNPRPRLNTPLTGFAVHYVGAGTSWTDYGDTARELASIETNHAIPQGKPNEYNSASDSEGVTWEYAGEFLAAHAGMNNSSWWGHLVVLGLEDPTPVIDNLIAGIRRARRQLVGAGLLTPEHRVLGHQDLPFASTGCPGPLRTNPEWWSQITAPLTTQEDTDMRTLTKPRRVYDSRTVGAPLTPRESREVVIGLTTEAFVNVTVIAQSGPDGYISVNDPAGDTSIVNYSAYEDRIEANSGPVLTPNGRVIVTNHVGVAHVVIDVMAEKP